MKLTKEEKIQITLGTMKQCPECKDVLPNDKFSEDYEICYYCRAFSANSYPPDEEWPEPMGYTGEE